MTSKTGYKEAFVWIWLPGESSPVVAGKLVAHGSQLIFNYGKSYLARHNAIALYEPELPLQPGELPLLDGLWMPGCIRDAAPDAWGRRVLINKLSGLKSAPANGVELDELAYLLESGSDRIGALDFQASAGEYIPRSSVNASLEELVQSAERVEKGLPLSEDLGVALQHGSSIGGARPKVLIEQGTRKKFIAKFSSTSDVYNVVKAEFIAMRLAGLAGIQVASVELTRTLNKDVLLVERFDRVYEGAWLRKVVVSALTLFGLDEMMARYAGYAKLAEIIRYRFNDAPETLRELFARMVFNVICGNTDDHARNHAAFWDGKALSLTPAYDICPQSRTGNEASQAMLIHGSQRMSRLAVCLDAAPHFLLSRREAIAIIETQIKTVAENWSAVCDMAELHETDRRLLWGRMFFNPYIFEGLDKDAAYLREYLRFCV